MANPYQKVADNIIKELQVLQKDAERYRFLRSLYEEGAVVTKRGTERFWTTIRSFDCGINDEPTIPFDTCVDSAMLTSRHDGDNGESR